MLKFLVVLLSTLLVTTLSAGAKPVPPTSDLPRIGFWLFRPASIKPVAALPQLNVPPGSRRTALTAALAEYLGILRLLEPGESLDLARSVELRSGIGKQKVAVYAVPTSRGDVCYGVTGYRTGRCTRDLYAGVSLRIDRSGTGTAVVTGLAANDVESADLLTSAGIVRLVAVRNFLFAEPRLPQNVGLIRLVVHYGDGSHRNIAIS